MLGSFWERRGLSLEKTRTIRPCWPISKGSRWTAMRGRSALLEQEIKKIAGRAFRQRNRGLYGWLARRHGETGVRRLVASLMCVVLMLAEASVASAASKTLELPFGGPRPRVTCDGTGKVCQTAKHRKLTQQALEHAKHRARLVALAAEIVSAAPLAQ